MRGCVAGGLSGITAVGAHALAGGGQPPSATAVALLVVACTAFGAVVSTFRFDRSSILPLLSTILAGQLIGHVAVILGSPHGHHGILASVDSAMIAGHVATALVDVVLIGLAESAAVWALGLLSDLLVADDAVAEPTTPPWVASPTPTRAPHGLRLAATAVTRGPPPSRFAF